MKKMNITESVAKAIAESISKDGRHVELITPDIEAAYDHFRPALDVSYENPGSAEVIRGDRADGLHVHGHDCGFSPFHIVIKSA